MQVEPCVRRPVPQGDVIGGAGELDHEGLKKGVPVGGGAGGVSFIKGLNAAMLLVLRVLMLRAG